MVGTFVLAIFFVGFSLKLFYVYKKYIENLTIK